ncbi:hypothetical protein FDZ71_05610, partial [bacterium]
MKLIAAPLLLPVAAPPIRDGAALVGDDGLILAVGPLRELTRTAPEASTTFHEDSVILPALINCHTHLELSSLPPIACDSLFVEWILEVVRRKRSAAPEDFSRGIKNGALECLRLGQGVLADVTSVEGAERHYPEEGPLVAHFRELIAPSPEGVEMALERPKDGALPKSAYYGGLFAHAPYTVCLEGYEKALGEALQKGGRLYTHLAESLDEVEFALTGGGPIAEELYGNIPVNPPAATGLHPVDWLARNNILGENTVAVHA